ESRPLREEPPAFLCAMVLLLCVHKNASFPIMNAAAPICKLLGPFGSRLLRQFPGLLAPVIDLVGAERHVGVDASNVLIGEGGKLGARCQALLVQLLCSNRADALDRGEIVCLAFRRGEQRRSSGFGL